MHPGVTSGDGDGFTDSTITAMPTLIMGETVENVATNMDIYSYRQPLGVTAGITPL